MKFRPVLATILAGITLSSAHATWFGENVENGADIMMMDLRYPWWGESTYNAHWNFRLNSQDNFSGYGGFTMGVSSLEPDHRPNFDSAAQSAFRPSAVWSFWGSNKAGEPVRVVATSKYNYPRQYIGEGASGSLGGPCWPVVKGQWYTCMMRLWKPAGVKNPDYTYLGRWVKDVQANHWHLYGIVKIPSKVSSFSGNGGFLEDFAFGGRSVSSLHRRLGYYRKEGAWKSSDTVTYDVPLRDTYWVVQKLENNTVLGMELSGDRSLLPQKLKGSILESGKRHSFTVEQPTEPTLDQPSISNAEAITNGKQVMVSWNVPHASSPQLGYKIEVFDNSECQGQPVTVSEQRIPTARKVLLEANISKPTIRLSMIDVFDQWTPAEIVHSSNAPSPAEATSFTTAPGLKYKLILKDSQRHENVIFPKSNASTNSLKEKHYWVSLDELKDGRLVQQGITHGFNTDLRGSRNHGYGFKFRGLLRVPRTGLYLFRMRGTDGYSINIDGSEALRWDGLHGPEMKTFTLNLAKGDHPLAVDYFVDKQEPFFTLEWQGPGLERQVIPRSALVHQATEKMPTSTLKASVAADGKATISVDVTAHGRQIERIQLFLGNMQVATSKSNMLQYSGLLPAGTFQLWSRVWYDKNNTLDSIAQTLNVPAPKVSGWKVGVAGEVKAIRNIHQDGPKAFNFVGDGEHTIFRNIKGNFTLTCRIDSLLGTNGEPVNGSSWVGLTVREHADKNNYKWGREFGIMRLAKYGLRTTPDWSDGGASRVSTQLLPAKHNWLRVVRQGSLWTAWTSPDGQSWTCGATHYKPLNHEVGAGIVFRALPQNSQMYFRARVSNLTLTPGLPQGFQLPAATPASGMNKADLTGVVVSPSNPNILVLRSSTRGLIRSVDQGKKWVSANGKLEGAANSIRSVAIHPTDPSVMLRAANTGLYITKDGGQSWQKLPFPGDFDGTGPSALCGEVIAFCPNKPSIILAGCETKGLFRSEDSGATWKLVADAGQRFTTVKFHPRDFKKDGRAYVHAITCTDRYMHLLGRGEPSATTPSKTSNDLISEDSGMTFRPQCQRTDLGYYNLTYGDPFHGTLDYGTSHGLLHSFNAGHDSYLFSTGIAMESYRPITALAAGDVKSQTWSRIYTQALSPDTPGRLSRCDYARNIRWRWQPVQTIPPATHIIAISPCDLRPSSTGNQWWLVTRDGLYQFNDTTGISKRLLK